MSLKPVTAFVVLSGLGVATCASAQESPPCLSDRAGCACKSSSEAWPGDADRLRIIAHSQMSFFELNSVDVIFGPCDASVPEYQNWHRPENSGAAIVIPGYDRFDAALRRADETTKQRWNLYGRQFSPGEERRAPFFYFLGLAIADAYWFSIQLHQGGSPREKEAYFKSHVAGWVVARARCFGIRGGRRD